MGEWITKVWQTVLMELLSIGTLFLLEDGAIYWDDLKRPGWTSGYF